MKREPNEAVLTPTQIHNLHPCGWNGEEDGVHYTKKRITDLVMLLSDDGTVSSFDIVKAAEDKVIPWNDATWLITKANLPLPEGLTSVGGDLFLRGYQHPLPEGLQSIGGDLDLYEYQHPLPEGLQSVGGGFVPMRVPTPTT